MTEQKYKSPEELGEAVGRKIEELFGGLFSDEKPEATEKAASQQVGSGAALAQAVPMAAPKPTQAVTPPKPAPAPQPEPRIAPAPQPEPVPKSTPAPKPAPATAQPARAAAPATAANQALGKKKILNSFDDTIEQIEVIILNLEWEVSPESVRELFQKFKGLEQIFSSDGPGKSILAMNMRILPRFDRPDSVPHPSLLRFLQDSVTALKALNAAPTRPPNKALVTSITNSYRQIMAAVAQPAQPTVVVDRSNEPKDKRVLVSQMGSAIRSLQEVSQRLSRILGVLRQGGDMSVEEMTRRLGTLEHLLSERVGHLSDLNGELFSGPLESDRPSNSGVLLVIWAGIRMGLPSGFLTALYLLTREQAEAYMDRQSLNLGSRTVRRLPLSRPKNAPRVLPKWLIHFSFGQTDFYVLADQLVGYRLAPPHIDIERQGKVRIGKEFYTLITPSLLGTPSGS
ncbi:hypothetical protein [Desulfomonile tiedjei]|uniref:Uncharacterized protein n=1 Tax=Desulfomonile tiedjei (strain ATCC 49306 / DSM 6799 / DCB-1) TaxID=706587 RepID=I4C0F4_DESTA|nr:hypothetical protein [Desulfomonile tiedjei]AFM23045.1 hypothetical protein Desti_0305 [Desulfomonile tiedjei DSM 6799]